MKDLYFIRFKGKSQLISCGVKADVIHHNFFKMHLEESFNKLRDLSSGDEAPFAEIELYTKRIVWSMIKAANKKTPVFEKWSNQIGELALEESTELLNEITAKINKRKVK